MNKNGAIFFKFLGTCVALAGLVYYVFGIEEPGQHSHTSKSGMLMFIVGIVLFVIPPVYAQVFKKSN